MPIPYVTVDKAIQIAKKYGGGSSSEKIWHEFALTPAESLILQNEGQLVKRLEKSYDGKTFAYDYIGAKMEVRGQYEGNLIGVLSPLSKLYVDFVHQEDWFNNNVKTALHDCCVRYGFSQQHYKMGYLYCQTNQALQSYVDIDTAAMDEIIGKLAGGLEREGDKSTGWHEGPDAPIGTGEPIQNGEVWIGYGEGKVVYLCYKLNDTYYWASKAEAKLVTLYGDNIATYEINHGLYAYHFTPNYIAANPLNGYNMIYIADTSIQPWDGPSDESNPISVDPGELEENVHSKQFAINIHGSNTKVSYVMCFEDDHLPYIDESAHRITDWKAITAGSVYKVYWDATLARFGFTADYPAVEISDTEKQTLFSTGITFNSVHGAEQVMAFVSTDEPYAWTAMVAGDEFEYLKFVFSANEEFEEAGDPSSSEFIGRPVGYTLKSIKYQDPDTGKYESRTDGGWVWTVPFGDFSLTAIIPVQAPNTIVFNYSDVTNTNYVNLHRHTLQIEVKDGESGYAYDCHILFLAINSQDSVPTTSYLLNSDTTTGWKLPATGVIKEENGATWYPVMSVETKSVNDIWSFVVTYLDTTDGYEKKEAVLFSQENEGESLAWYTVSDTDSVVKAYLQVEGGISL